VSAVWQARLAAFASRGAAAVFEGVAWVGRPDVLPRLRLVIGAVLVSWIAVSLWRAAWSLFPEAPPLPSMDVINPMQQNQSLAADGASRVDIEALAAVPLFGVPGETLSEEVLAAATGGRAAGMSEADAARELAGIEDGAPESRLPLILQGVVAASEAGLGQAVIEHRNVQDLYQVGDEMPVAGDVVLAKVLPDRVVLENSGRYEILRLFEDSGLERVAVGAPQVVPRADATSPPPRPAPAVAAPVPREAAAVAARYRERLYENPESLADVVRISAVRDGDALRGYRVMPGRNAAEFAALGFRAGDVVTAVNGMSLSDPSNPILLYQAMREATSASFELEREGEAVTLQVSLEGSGGSGDS
jgi:general secretion pathway protein C